jgi:hypothetical protein
VKLLLLALVIFIESAALAAGETRGPSPALNEPSEARPGEQGSQPSAVPSSPTHSPMPSKAAPTPAAAPRPTPQKATNQAAGSGWAFLIPALLGFIGGSAAGAFISAWYQARAARVAREVEHLDQQLRLLYGPLHFLVSQNADLFKLSGAFHEAYTAEFVAQKFAPEAMESVRRDADATIDIANSYVVRVAENNEGIMQILKSGWQHVDPGDVETFSHFQIDYLRFRTEVWGKMRLSTPLSIYARVGPISYMRPEIVQRVREAFTRKTERLRELRGARAA